MMVIVILSILQSIVCQLIENTIDQQLWLATIDLPNCGTSSKNLILHFPTKSHPSNKSISGNVLFQGSSKFNEREHLG